MAETKEFQPTISDFSFAYITHSQGLLILLIFFCSSFLLFVCFFLHLVSRFSHITNTLTATATATATTPTTTTFNPNDHVVQVGLDASSISRIPVVLHGSLGIPTIEKRECSICLGLFEDDEMVKVLPECLHAYHSDCVDMWLRTRSSCPLCRSSIDSIASMISVD